MKYCLSARQEYNYLKKVAEIKFQFRDRKAIPDFAERYPGATIILQHTSQDDEIKWEDIKTYNILCKNNFILCTYSIEECNKAKENEIKFYLGYPIQTYYQLNSVIKLGVCYLRLDAPLFFELDKVKRLTNIPIRAIPNVCYIDGYPRENGVFGTWIRPEDTEAYDEYISTYEFEDADLQKERALYRIYTKGEWPGDFNMLFTNFNAEGVNRMIMSEHSRQRLNCGQKCQIPGHRCRICQRIVHLANPQLIKDYKENIAKQNSET